MAVSLTTITNSSSQVVPILINSIDPGDANANANIPANEARQLALPPGSETRIETQRIDLAQLQKLRDLQLISYTTA